uniref:Epidermal growth factor n=1 Tax=Mastacembelus armatus TaxID=205130 RepID=A0A3Q3MM30_9TELE
RATNLMLSAINIMEWECTHSTYKGCISSQPFLIFGHGKAIHRIDLDGKNHRRLVAGAGSSILLDFHFREEKIYWADKHTGMIYKKLYSSDKHISGLAVDWIWNSVYWTSVEKGKIKKMDINGKNERTLLRHLIQPSSIVVDPIKRFIFWLSGGMNPNIQRSDVTGKMKTTLIKKGEQLKALTIDREDKRLFWVQADLQGQSAIASLLLKKKPKNIMLHLYYTNAATRVIKQVNKYTGGKPLDVNKKQMAKTPVAIKVVHPLNQPMADSLSPFPDVNECAHWNHGCSLGCENIPGSYFCTCPKGYALLPDRKTCQACGSNITNCGHGCLETDDGVVCVCPEGSILQEDGQACTGCSSADRGGCSQLCILVNPNKWQCGCLAGYQLHQDGKYCTATGPPPYLLLANLVDVRKINPDGTGAQTLLEDPRGTIIALDYDPVENKVYFASTSQKTIERVDVNGGSRVVLVSENLNSPEGLAIDWIHRRMYWTDKSSSFGKVSLIEDIKDICLIHFFYVLRKLFWTDIGTHPVVESASLEGKDRAVIVSINLVSPSGLTIDFTEDRLFWCDQRRGLVETAALDGSNRRIILENQVGRPFDLAVFEDKLWISDQAHQQLRSVHKRTGKKLQRIHGNMFQPASIVVVHPLAKPVADICLHQNGGCAQVCESKLGVAHCSCLSHYILSADKKGCLLADASNRTEGDFTIFFSVILHISTQMICNIDECKLGTHNCNKNAECQNTLGKYLCKCQAGYNLRLKTSEGFNPIRFRILPADVTTRHHNSNSVQSCPSTHESYCLYQGVCFYFPEMESYACNCVSGYMGERCQFSDLEWWELQQAEEEKRRNVTIAACMVVLISLLSIALCLKLPSALDCKCTCEVFEFGGLVCSAIQTCNENHGVQNDMGKKTHLVCHALSF